MLFFTPLQATNRQSQNGSALVIGLIFLVLLSLIGVASMQSTGLQERMAANFRDQNEALQAAEAALREGEQRVSAAMRAGLADANTLTENVVENWPTTCPDLDAANQIPCPGLDSSPASMACMDDLPKTTVAVDGASGEYTFLPVNCSIGRGGSALNNECSDTNRVGLPNACPEDECKFMLVGRGSASSGNSQAILQSLYCGPALEELALP